MLHKFPHEVEDMPYEDALALMAYCELEAERLEKDRERRTGVTKNVQTTRLKKRK